MKGRGKSRPFFTSTCAARKDVANSKTPKAVWPRIPTILDDFSRYIIAWKLCTTMAASDVTETLELALAAPGSSPASVRHRPRLLSDNGPSYIAADLAEWLKARKMEHVRGAPCHPQT